MVFNVTEQLQVLEEQYATCEHLPAANPALVQQQLVTSKVYIVYKHFACVLIHKRVFWLL